MRWSVVAFAFLATLFLAGDSARLRAQTVPAGLPPDRPLDKLTITQWTVDGKLPTNTLTDVLQTSDGYLWLASFNGLIRFDGTRFEVFDRRSVSELPTSSFYELLEDRDGRLWIATQGAGVLRYAGGRFQPIDPALRHTVRALLIDATDRLWIGTSDFGAFRYDGERFVAFAPEMFEEVTVRDLVETTDGTIWFATEGRGVSGFRAGRWRSFDAASGLASDVASCLCEDRRGGLWVGTADGLSRIEDGAARSLDALEDVEVYRCAVDDYGSLWLATEQGLIRRDARSGALERLSETGEHVFKSLAALELDREGALWVASYADGLFQLKESRFIAYDSRDGLASERVNTVCEIGEDRYLVGVDGGVVNEIAGGRVVGARVYRSLPDVRVRHVAKAGAGALWISSYAGLLEVDGGVETLYTTADGLPTDQVRFTHYDRRGALWIGTRNGGLVKLDPDGAPRFEALGKDAGLISDFVFSVAEGAGGERLIGTYEGLTVLSPDGEATSYGPAEGLPGSIVFSVRVDETGAAWLATSGGLSRLRDGELKTLGFAGGLPAESVFDCMPDGRGSVWLASSSGVIEIPQRELDDYMDGRIARVDATLYNDRDGMPVKECTGAAKILRASDGSLWFPTLGGVAVIEPGAVKKNPVPPMVDLKRFLVDGVATDGAGAPLEIGADARQFAFEFAALSFLDPAKVTVLYRLSGFDEDWVDAGAERAVRYTNLPPGEYSFQVLAANDDGVWNEEGATVAFRVVPRFTQTWPLRLLAVLALVGAARAVYRWRVRQIRRRNAQLQRIVAKQRATARERDRLIGELEASNEELERYTYTISHDLKSPLITISGFLGLLEKDLEAGRLERVKHDLDRIYTAAGTMARLLDELLELSRVGRVTNEPEEIPLRELVVEAVDQVAGRVLERAVTIDVAPDLPVVRGDRPRLLELYQNLIENAVKFMGDQEAPRIEIGVEHRDGEDVYFVRDNGIGVVPEYRDKIFGLFERLDHKIDGTGIGLALVKRVVENHGGRVWVESAGAGRGATFCFTLSGTRDRAVAQRASSELR